MGNQQTTLNRKRLDEVVDLLKKELSDPEMRKLNNRAIQARVFQIPQISQYMQDLRLEEEKIRQKNAIINISSNL
jgi:protein subunit release factor A